MLEAKEWFISIDGQIIDVTDINSILTERSPIREAAASSRYVRANVEFSDNPEFEDWMDKQHAIAMKKFDEALDRHPNLIHGSGHAPQWDAPVYSDRYEEHVHIGTPSNRTHFTTRETGDENMSGYFKNVRLDFNHCILGDCVKCGVKGVNLHDHIQKGCSPIRAAALEGKEVFVRGKYKIHALPTANKEQMSSGNSVFYEEYDEALNNARSYVMQPRNQNPCVPMVIYKAIKVIVPENPPVIECKVR